MTYDVKNDMYVKQLKAKIIYNNKYVCIQVLLNF